MVSVLSNRHAAAESSSCSQQQLKQQLGAMASLHISSCKVSEHDGSDAAGAAGAGADEV